MIFKRYDWHVLLRILYLFIALSATAYFLLKGEWLFVVYSSVLVLLALYYFYRYLRKIQDEIEQFTEAVHYRDFTRSFAWQRAPAELRVLRKGFNEVNAAFKTISREKETQYQYLQNILQLVDTGILAFQPQTGEILWINDSLKQMLDIPYLKNISLLQSRDPGLLKTITDIKYGESRVIDLKKEHATQKVLLNVTAFQTEGKRYKLMAFQNINEAIDETESQAWQRLLGVMTHEIMNSVAPIASLADTLKKRLQQKNSSGLLEDLEEGIDTIKRRSEGLTKFADTYRNLSKISRLAETKITVADLYENIYRLMSPTLQQKNIALEIVLRDTSLILEADRNLLEQVLINLILNAVEAVREKPSASITLSASREKDKIILSVADNGKGIPSELMDKIFIPFFSTRKNGNGIGLSLCKQIMMLHGGNIRVHTQEGVGTSFRLIFKSSVDDQRP